MLFAMARRRGSLTSKTPWSNRHHPVRRITYLEASQATQLSLRKIRVLAVTLTWNKVSVSDMIAFLKGFNVEVCHLQTIRYRLWKDSELRERFGHLTRREYHALCRRVSKYESLRKSIDVEPVAA